MDTDQLVVALVARRTELGLTQRDAAARIGISQSLLSYLERRIADPSADCLQRWADVLGVETGDADA